MESNHLQGQVLVNLFGLPNLQTILAGNPFCEKTGATKTYYVVPQPNFTSLYFPSPNSCPPARCSSDKVSSPTCRCAYPYTGILSFRAISFSDLGNQTVYDLQTNLTQFFWVNELPVDSVSLSNPRLDPYRYLLLNLSIFPFGLDGLNRTEVFTIAFIFTNQSYKPSSNLYGPYTFDDDAYNHFSAVGGSVLLLFSLLARVYAFHQKKKVERASLESNPFAHWDVKKSSGSIPQLKVADFGLSKLISDSEKAHVTTQGKGTMLVTGRRPIERGKYIVREVRMAMDKTKDLYSLHQILDQAITDTSLKGLEKFVDLAMSCVEESGVDRPTMGEVVKEIENIT
ncbi:hypothetical protein SLEP1_g40267 [Rubroshorea leprosula]|uniref:Uncharacterized protein n=1 Tax=Rubroshorea leprosula TaxID=152421 RepID=A0AAV5L3H9_9ROSI|nr:hypothetical protein SLEP1_g40267 [Rubroshorea leprosula]